MAPVQSGQRRSTPKRWVEDLPASPKLQGASTPRYNPGIHSRTTHKAQHFTLSRANLALALLEIVLRYKDLINWHFDGLETFFNVCVASVDTSNLK